MLIEQDEWSVMFKGAAQDDLPKLILGHLMGYGQRSRFRAEDERSLGNAMQAWLLTLADTGRSA